MEYFKYFGLRERILNNIILSNYKLKLIVINDNKI